MLRALRWPSIILIVLGAGWIALRWGASPPSRALSHRQVTPAGVPATAEDDADDDRVTAGDDGWMLRRSATSPSPRHAVQLAYDPARRATLMFGGNPEKGPAKYVDDTWLWDGTDWTRAHPAESPPPLANHSLVFDSARKVAVLFGGRDLAGKVLNETWEWNGNTWTRRSPVHRPPPRVWFAMVYDSTRRVTVAFGGCSTSFDDCFKSHSLNDTWEWDGDDWSQRSPAHNPPRRGMFAMAYDAARRVTVLFGGQGAADAILDDTWEWDGLDWLERSPAAYPPPRWAHSMTWDARRRVTLLVGGAPGLDVLQPLPRDTWEWDGNTWRAPQLRPAAPGRILGGLTYDTGRGVAVLAGGAHPQGRGLADLDDTRERAGP